jgi:hypothetical protein
MDLQSFAREFIKESMVPGMETHKGRTMPKEVRSLADRIRKKNPEYSDEKAYRIANDIYSSYVSHQKKSKYSGLKSEGGKTEKPLSKD